MNDVIARYLDCWNETDQVARRKAIEAVWAADAEYIDPLAEARGRAEIDALIAGAQSQFPGLVFARIGPVDAHHRQARFRWGLARSGTGYRGPGATSRKRRPTRRWKYLRTRS